MDKIRRITKGGVCLQLKKTGSSQIGRHRRDVEVALAEIATVKALCQEITIECRDLDEIITKDDICKAIAKDFPHVDSISESNIKSLRTMPVSNTQIARISLSVKAAIIS